MNGTLNEFAELLIVFQSPAGEWDETLIQLIERLTEFIAALTPLGEELSEFVALRPEHEVQRSVQLLRR